jgi:signal transduction histidine kinase
LLHSKIRGQQQEKGQEEQKQNDMLEMLEIILRNANRLHQLTENILDVTRIQSHTLKLRKERFNLEDAILSVVEDYRKQIASGNNNTNNIKLIYEPRNGTILVEADRQRLTQVISNLLGNAIKFTKEEGGTVIVSIDRRKEDRREALVAITDTGIGIDGEIMPRLFTQFATKSYHGTGLGLFISKSIVEAHGGRMWANNNNNNDSDRKHKGATFYFTLPVADMNEQTREDLVRLVND